MSLEKPYPSLVSLSSLVVQGPANEAVSHRNVVPGALTSTSKYHGPPTDEVDANWEALYVPCTLSGALYTFSYAHSRLTDLVSSIDKKGALRLENPHDDVAWDSDPTKFAVQVEVFHHLHCLVSRSHSAVLARRTNSSTTLSESDTAGSLARAVPRRRVKSLRNSARGNLQPRRPLHQRHQRVPHV